MVDSKIAAQNLRLSGMIRNKVIENVEVIGLADKGQAIGKDPDGAVVFLTGAVPGDIVDARILKKRKGCLQGVPERFLQYSKSRQEPECLHFGDCGGCKWQHLRYESQLHEKEKIVRDAFQRIAKTEVQEILPILESPTSFFYRNKMEFSFSAQRWISRDSPQLSIEDKNKGALGLHPPRFFSKVVDIHTCLLMDPRADQIRNFVRFYAYQYGLSFYNTLSHRGLLRSLIIRNSSLGQWMVVMSFGAAEPSVIDHMLNAIKDKFPWISSLQYVINQKKNDSLYDREIIPYSGKPFIEEQLAALRLKIRPKSFFQTNTQQAHRLYQIASDFASTESDQIVYDLYTGTGSIALYLADKCKTVVGIEEVEDAVADARENAASNDINNTHFYCGDVKNVLTENLLEDHGRPDTVIVDPPRGGMHTQVIEKLLEIVPERIVYISCNPSTQARDVNLMLSHYEVEKIHPVDMFPHTHHIENVALLVRR